MLDISLLPKDAKDLLPFLTPQEIEEIEWLLTPTIDPFDCPDPITFLTTFMVIPETGKPLTLHSRQVAVIREMLRRDSDGNFVYPTMLYSAPKKSAKTTICAGIALWHSCQIADGDFYVVGNDLKQADNRMNQAIRYAVEHHPAFADAEIVRNTIRLPNGTKIEAVPVDPAGEAGSNPIGIGWTEAWGAKHKKHEEMWSEMTLSPTRAGKSFKLVESYAGHVGESVILERLYDYIIRNGQVVNLPDAPDEQELYVNGSAIGYWSTERYLDWQDETQPQVRAYYESERINKTPAEYRRLHHNEWVQSEDVFVEDVIWRMNHGVTPHQERDNIVVGVDAGVSSDCFAIVGLIRRGDTLYPKYKRAWIPDGHNKIDFAEPMAYLRHLCQTERVILATYDPYQLHDTMTQFRREKLCRVEEFSQGGQRSQADKQLRDMIYQGRFIHDSDPTLTEHFLNANCHITGQDDDRMRMVKRHEGAKIDLAVACSMAAWWAMRLNIG